MMAVMVASDLVGSAAGEDPCGGRVSEQARAGVDLIERAAGWKIEKAPVLGDRAYGDNSVLRERLHDAELQYVLSVGAQSTVFAPETTFTVPEREGSTGRPRSEDVPVAVELGGGLQR